MFSRDGKIARRPRLGQFAAEGACLAALRVAVEARAAIKTNERVCAFEVAPLPFILPVALTLVETLQASVVGGCRSRRRRGAGSRRRRGAGSRRRSWNRVGVERVARGCRRCPSRPSPLGRPERCRRAVRVGVERVGDAVAVQVDRPLLGVRNAVAVRVGVERVGDAVAVRVGRPLLGVRDAVVVRVGVPEVGDAVAVRVVGGVAALLGVRYAITRRVPPLERAPPRPPPPAAARCRLPPASSYQPTRKQEAVAFRAALQARA